MAAERTESAPAVDRAITVLELLAASRFGLTLPELVQRTRWPKSSLHYLLVTLERRRYLYRNPLTGRYVFGLKLFSLATAALNCVPIRYLAASTMKQLTDSTGLTSHLAILEQNEAILIAKLEPLGTCRLATWVGKRMDMHCTGLGKAILAHLSSDLVDRLIGEHGLPRHNDNTLSSPRKLKEDLSRIRQRGYAIDDEEDEVGMRCIGAPVFDISGAVIASISVSGTTEQIRIENMGPLAELVKSAAADITGALSRSTQIIRTA